ncbi:MAG: hypothetical protein Q8Q08_06500 [Candidatus Omnitrophota bacterium]|nr:hypothetical protein [Candidatus Omnitrophota bacterium]MDZ4243261.1 hypothetical protein [Candidatus Omnitrophota bacterium]
MARPSPTEPRLTFLFVLATTLAIFLILAYQTFYINYWPSDSFIPYIPAASHLFETRYFSEIHSIPINQALWITMHAKETLILGIAVLQRLLRDIDSLYPNVLLLLMSVAASSLFLYGIFRKLAGPFAGVLAFALFTGTFWPYMYCLQGAHQPLVFAAFLGSAYFILASRRSRIFHLLSGLFFGFMVFSSPTSFLYVPYWAALFVRAVFYDAEIPAGERGKEAALRMLFVLPGVLAVVLLFTLPDPAHSLREFIAYVRFSQYGNNFAIYHNYVYQYSPIPPYFRGAGWPWVLKYFFLIMPVLFGAYVLAVFYFFRRGVNRKLWLLIILFSLSTPIAVETSHVAQFGRNYFSWLFGIIGLVCLAADDIRRRLPPGGKRLRAALAGIAVLVLAGHIAHNAYIFLTDVFPSRLATTRIHGWLQENNVLNVYTYQYHPLKFNFIAFLNNPKQPYKINFRYINTLREAKDGLILIPPITGKNIYKECRDNDYYRDPYLTQLYGSGRLGRFVAGDFPTLASSRIWAQEEEICTYMDLILGRISGEDRRKGRVIILDAAKLQKEWFLREDRPFGPGQPSGL